MQPNVLLIDDDNYIHLVVGKSLDPQFKLISAFSAEEGIKQAIVHNPTVIILDVELPNLTGYEVCKMLRNDQSTMHIPLLFLSSRSSLNERLKGYSVGADDYLVKPFSSEELLAKVAVLTQYRARIDSLATDVRSASKVAENVIADSGDFGRLMRFVSQSYNCNELPLLMQKMFDLLEQYQLKAACAVWLETENQFFSSRGVIAPIEQNLLEQCRQGDRFADFGPRTIINYPRISLLIKNMPLDLPERYGRYKDILPHMLEAMSAKLIQLQVQQLVLTQADELSSTFSMIDQSLRQQLTLLEQHSKDATDMIDGVQDGLQQYLMGSLTETDVTQMSQTLGLLKQHLSETDDIHSAVDEVLTYMHHVLEERSDLIVSLRASMDSNTEQQIANNDIELF